MVPLFLIGLVLASAAPPGPPVTLAPPICEPSALLARPGGTFLVGDNERDALYEIDDRGAMLATLPLPGAPADVEALAAWGDAVVVVGSHSRGNPRKGCEVKERRLALLVARVAGEALTGRLITVDGPLDGGMDKRARNGLGERRAASLAAVPACVQGWFQGRPAGAEAVCAALVAAEARAAL
ncbi:MAG: hypothetical protein KC549_17475, partial [Myxococcales bacterium]|nr:hypothetical protein [Myxococcales bacterium]